MDTYIYDCVRTPRAKGKPDGTLSGLEPQDLVSQLVTALDQRNDGACQRAEQMPLGCVGQVEAQGGNIATLARLHAGLPDGISAYSLNNHCISGLTAIGNASNAVAAGQAEVALAGGVEQMSRVPFLADRAAFYKNRSLPKASRFHIPALAADLLATREQISRTELDRVSARSHERAHRAETEDTRLNRSRIPVYYNGGSAYLDRDERVRSDVTMEGLAELDPAFPKLDEFNAALVADREHEARHSVSNAPGMVDGAAMGVIGAGGLAGMPPPRARIVAIAESTGAPADGLTGGFASMHRILKRTGMTLSDFDRIEFMEAFAVVPALFLRDYDVDPDKVNVAGGHLAKGHPLGASGAILASSLLDVLDAADGNLGLVVATGASGLGAAMILERQSS